LVSREWQGKYESNFKRSSSKSKKPACSLEVVNGVLEAKIKSVLRLEKKTKLLPKSPADSVGKLKNITQEMAGI